MWNGNRDVNQPWLKIPVRWVLRFAVLQPRLGPIRIPEALLDIDSGEKIFKLNDWY